MSGCCHRKGVQESGVSQTILALHDAECVDVVRDFRSILSFKNLTFLRPFCCVVNKFLSIVKKHFIYIKQCTVISFIFCFCFRKLKTVIV